MSAKPSSRGPVIVLVLVLVAFLVSCGGSDSNGKSTDERTAVRARPLSGGPQLQVLVCNANSRAIGCAGGEATDAQITTIEQVLATHPEVEAFAAQSKDVNFAIWKKYYIPRDEEEKEIFDAVTAADMQASYWITLADPEQYQGISAALEGLDGVDAVSHWSCTYAAEGGFTSLRIDTTGRPSASCP